MSDGLRGSFDWEAAYARLEAFGRALEETVEPAPEEVRRILRERALSLARPQETAPAPSEGPELVVFSLGEERYGIEAAHVHQVVPLRELTRVPCTPPFVLGVINHRGRILAVLDLRRFLNLSGLSGQDTPEGGRVVVVDAGGMTFGIRADSVAGIHKEAARELAPPPVTLASAGRAFVRGVAGDMIAVLDAEALARDPGIRVQEEAS